MKNFDDFFSVDEIQKVHDQHDGSYKKDYYNNFYCPECLRAELSFHPNAQTPHFRSKRLQNTARHHGLCSHNFDPASKKQLDEYYNDKGNHDAINRKLKTCLELLHRCNQKNKVINMLSITRGQPEDSNYFTIDVKGGWRSLRRKKISTPFTPDNYNMPILFYGTMLMEWDLRNDDVKYLRVKNINTNAYVCSISISNTIYSYIEDHMKFDGKQRGDIAFLSCMEKKDNFNNCRIKYSTELIISVDNIN